jgi:hypothetical protein
MDSKKTDNGRINRRSLLRGAAATATSAWMGSAARAQASGNAAVVFLSRSSNTRMLAGDISRRFGADLFEIRPNDPWPADYEEMVDWASQWRQSDRFLPLAAVPDVSAYGSLFLGFPIWGMSLPAPMRSFLASVDLSGKTVYPFITHGGYGPGDTMDEVRDLASAARISDPFVLQCDQERDNLDALREWLDDTVAG